MTNLQNNASAWLDNTVSRYMRLHVLSGKAVIFNVIGSPNFSEDTP
jgi:hypothetical protein